MSLCFVSLLIPEILGNRKEITGNPKISGCMGQFIELEFLCAFSRVIYTPRRVEEAKLISNVLIYHNKIQHISENTKPVDTFKLRDDMVIFTLNFTCSLITFVHLTCLSLYTV